MTAPTVRKRPVSLWLRGARVNLPARFWSKVERRGPEECWTWKPPLDRKGYGRIRLNIPDGKAAALAHRVSYELLVGPIPDGLTLDHLCRIRSCVNPRHLEPVTSAENTRRGHGPAMVTYRTGICKRGHDARQVSYVYFPGGGRRCRACYDLRNEDRRPGPRPPKTHCPQGHPYDEVNTYRIPSRPTARYCRACQKARNQR